MKHGAKRSQRGRERRHRRKDCRTPELTSKSGRKPRNHRSKTHSVARQTEAPQASSSGTGMHSSRVTSSAPRGLHCRSRATSLLTTADKGRVYRARAALCVCTRTTTDGGQFTEPPPLCLPASIEVSRRLYAKKRAHLPWTRCRSSPVSTPPLRMYGPSDGSRAVFVSEHRSAELISDLRGSGTASTLR